MFYMGRTKALYSNFDFAEAKGNEAKARLQLLCELINNPPPWLNAEGIKAFLQMVRMVRDGRVPELAITDDLDIHFHDGRWHVGFSQQLPVSMRPEETMKWLYRYWITNPLHEKFDGPCPGRRNGQLCGKYYVRRTAEQKACIRACGKDAAARNFYKESREEKLQTARALMREWKPTRQWPDWKRFVYAKHRHITPNFLTHAVNKGELTPPKGEK